MTDLANIKSKFQILRPILDEKLCRLWAASEARVLGKGGTSLVARATGMSRTTILRGSRDLEHLETVSTSTLAIPLSVRHSTRTREEYRSRRPGGGRKLTEEKYPTIMSTLEELLSNEVAGDPMGKQKWIRSSLQQLSKDLEGEGYRASTGTISRLLRDQGFSLRTNKRKQLRSECPERDEQFRYIDAQRNDFTIAGLPIISVDTKKKELIGDFRNDGKVWCRQADEVNEHDFPDAAECRAVPFGIYDVTRNKGYVVVGTSHDTPEFAVNAITRWWKSDGRTAYPKATQLLILADGGGSNSSRTRAWKFNLQEKLSNRFRIVVTVCHYPPGCSKWNPVEHRLFSQISRNWAGRPLRTLAIMLGYIRGTTTKTGLKVKAFLDDDFYKKQKVKTEDYDRLNLRTHTVCPSWNYTISPMQ